MKIYVAGKWQEKPAVRKVQEYLVARGHEITFDWTSVDLEWEVPAGAQHAAELGGKWYMIRELQEQAVHDIVGVKDADVLVFIATNPHKYAGAFTEMGVAIGKGIPVYLIGQQANHNIFRFHPLVSVFDSMEELPL